MNWGTFTQFALISLIIASALDVFAQPLFGALSDRIGRRPVFIFGSLWFGLSAFPFFWLVNTGSPTLVVLAMILSITIGHGATYSVQASFVSELFGTRVRYSGLSIVYHLSTALFSGPAAFLAAALLAWTGGTSAISLVIVVLALVSAIATGLLGETKEANIDDPVPLSERDATDADAAQLSFQGAEGADSSR
jgi:MFS family permease